MKKSKATVALIAFTVLVLICLAVGLLIARQSNDTEQPETVGEPVNIQINNSDIDNGNPLDYSALEPGTEFYDEFWNGTVTIVGEISDVEYSDLIDNAHGRLITNQDGMYIYVYRTEEQQKAVDTVEPTNPDDIPSEEIEVSIAGDDQEFYSSPAVSIENDKAAIPSNGSILFPSQIVTGVRYVIAQYLSDIEMPDVQTVTVLDNTLSFAEAMRGYDCKIEGKDGVLGVHFNMNTGMWTMTYQVAGESKNNKREYSPLDFVAPSKRQQVADDLNELLGYERFQYSTQEAATTEETKTETKSDASEGTAGKP